MKRTLLVGKTCDCCQTKRYSLGWTFESYDETKYLCSSCISDKHQAISYISDELNKLLIVAKATVGE